MTANIPSLSLNNVLVFEVIGTDGGQGVITNPQLQGNVIADCVEGGPFVACVQNMLQCELELDSDRSSTVWTRISAQMATVAASVDELRPSAQPRPEPKESN